MKQSNLIEERMLDKIIRVAYGEGNIFDRMVVSIRSKNNPQIKKLLEEYSLTVSVLNNIKSEKCPSELSNNVYKKIAVNNYSNSFTDKLFDVLFKKFVISAAAIIIITGVISIYIINQKRAVPYYSEKQVVLAEKQVKESLALIDRVFQNTGKTVKDDVLKKQVAPPLKEGIYVINNLFKGG